MATTIKRKKVASVRYTGELATPIVEIPIGGKFFGEDAQAAQQQYYSHQWNEKLKALFDWYAIDRAEPKAWERLALSLACDHVPGMSVHRAPKRRGRTPFWEDGANAARLLREVEDLRVKNQRMTIRKALQTLRKRDEWKRHAQQSLEVRHREALRTEQDHRRLYREWKENPGGLHIVLLKAFAVDLDEYFERRRLEGFNIDEI